MADEPEVVEKRGRGRPRKTRPVPEEDHQSELSVLFDSLESKLSATIGNPDKPRRGGDITAESSSV